MDGMDRSQMRTLADSLRNKWKSAVIVLAGGDDGAVSIVSGVTKDLTGKVQAGKLVGQVAQAIGGKGGGRPDMAEGGGKDVGALAGALQAVHRTIEAAL
jgi:alanyl-tRNA synthetase